MYEKYYQFKNLPFRLNPDPSFFFGSKGHNRALSYLRYGLTQKEGFIVITGTPGTGKTTIARALLHEIGREKIVVSELNTTHLQAEDVLRMVAASFGLEHENVPKATILKRLEAFCTSRFRAGYHVLLMVDEAQNLPPESLEELRMLSNFYLGKDALIQIFLLGQQQFRDHLYSKQMEQLRQRVVASCHLEPLNITETREYIEYRLKRVGWNDDPKISDRAFARIFSYTKGVPRRVNTFCDRLFLYGAIEEIHQFRDEDIKEVAKELTYEVSAEGVNLDQIKPENVLADEDIAPGSVKLQKPDTTERESLLDSEQLQGFSDSVNPLDTRTESEVATKRSEESGLDEFYPVSKNSEHEAKVSSRKNIVQFSAKENLTNKADIILESTSMPTDQESNSCNWWELLNVCVEYYKQPAKFRGVSSEMLPTEGLYEILQVAVGSRDVPDYVRTGPLQHLTDDELKNAIRLYIQHALLSNGADYYRRLGVPNNANMEVIKTHYKLMFRLFQPDENSKSDWDESYTRRINQAYGTLHSVEKRQQYDRYLSSISEGSTQDKKVDRLSVINGGTKSGALEIVSETLEVPQAGLSNNNVKSTPSASRMRWSVVATVTIMLVGGLAATYMYQPQVKNLIAFGGSDNEAVPQLEPVQREPVIVATQEPVVQKTNESAELQKILEPVESIFIPKPDTLKEIASAVEETFKNGVESGGASTSVRQEAGVSEKKPVLQANIEQPRSKESKPSAKVEPVNTSKVTLDKPAKVVDVNMPPIANEKLAMLTPQTDLSAANVRSKRDFVEKISNTELAALITDFSIAYEEGNLSQLMGFFTGDAVVNGTRSKEAIRADYASLFSTTDMRVIDLHGLSWDIQKQKAVGEGEFLITLLSKGTETMENLAGRIKVEVVKSNGQLRLVGIKHQHNLQQ